MQGKYGQAFDELNKRLKKIDSFDAKVLTDAIGDPNLIRFANLKRDLVHKATDQEIYLQMYEEGSKIKNFMDTDPK